MQTTISVKSHEPINCDGCDHPIPEGQPILSDIPEQIPEDFPREAFRHFHIHCHRCGANSIPCYQQYASRQASFAAQANTDCDRCGHTIHEGQDVMRDSLFIWNTTRNAGDNGVASGGLAGIGRTHKSIAPTPFKTLGLKRKFVKAGLGKDRGYRTVAQAEELYLRSVPRQVRQFGLKGVTDFLKGKDASHIESVANQPGKANMPWNILWEPPQWNLRRGSANMKFLERTRAHGRNGADAARIVGKNALLNARTGAMWGALLEAPVSAVEGTICVAKGKMSKKDAAKKAAMNTAKSSAVAGTTVIGFTVAASLGAGPVLTAASPVLILIGGAIYGVSTVQRIQAAMNNPNPLPRVPFYFHTGCSDCGTGLSCFEELAAEVSRPA